MTQRETYYYRIDYGEDKQIVLKREIDTDLNAVSYILTWIEKFNERYSHIWRVRAYSPYMRDANKILDIFLG